MLIITGMSGAGKSIALKTLEDIGYYCVDNLPVVLLESFVREFAHGHEQPVAVAIDSRNPAGIAALPAKIAALREGCRLELIFLNAATNALARRFSESRRPHPLRRDDSDQMQIIATIEKERALLGALNNIADILIDTSTYSTHELRAKIIALLENGAPQLLITLHSFGFKHGIPVNADFLFDLRFLPNPHWQPELRRYSGTEQPVIDWLDAFPIVRRFSRETADYLARFLPHFVSGGNRAYLTICFGCTGGQHRSVYVAEAVGILLREAFPGVQIEHRDMIPGDNAKDAVPLETDG